LVSLLTWGLCRTGASIPTIQIFDAVFLGAACQFPAVHRIETECKRGGVLSKRIGPLSENAIGYALERYDSRAVFQLGCDVARQLKRNGVFRSAWTRGLVVAAVDRIEICSSFMRFCDHCMERKVTHLVEGEPARRDAVRSSSGLQLKSRTK
jgi:hypothetical protein